MSAIRGLLAGAAAGAAGTTALNAVTYLDMAARGRGASSAAEDVVVALADKADATIPGDAVARKNRVAGLGPLGGLIAAVGVGTGIGPHPQPGWRPSVTVCTAVAAIGAMAGADGPIAVLGISDPRLWSAKDWTADVIPHLAYGAVTATVLRSLDHH